MTALALGAVALTLLGSTGEGRRVALLVGSDVGLPGEVRLRSTGADADRLAGVLRELGGFAPSDVRVLDGRTGAEILDALDALARDEPASLFLFFYSGHADSGALHPGGTLLPLDLLLHRLRAVRAGLRITILDACQSGAATRAKGSTPAAPFRIDVDGEASSGDILISSSAADEQAFEGEHGSLFTLHWSAGLRGAADANGDGRVTLGEAYEYGYAQTLRATLAAAAGPQHASYQYRLSGRQDPVLTRLAGGALLTLRPAGAGQYVVFDGRERSVVAEVPSRPGEPRTLALAPGGYVVQQRGTRSLRVARVQLARGDDRVLADHQMQEVPLVRLARKGSPGERRFTASAGQYASGLGTRGGALGAVGVEWDGACWTPGLDVGFSSAEEEHRGLPTRTTLLHASASALYAVRAGTAALRLGPAAGVAWIRQATGGRAARDGMGLTLGMRLRGDLRITPAMALYAAVDGRALATRLAGDPGRPGARLGGVGMVPWGAYSVGLSADF